MKATRITKLPFSPSIYRWVDRSAFFVPGLVFILLGVVALVAPWLIVAAVALGLFVIGTLLCWLGWQAFKLKKRFESMSQKLKAHVIVQGVGPTFDHFDDLESEEEIVKKIFFH